MNYKNLAFIGGGNMARSLIGGLVSGGYPPARITVSDPLPPQLNALSHDFGINTTDDNNEAVKDAEIIVLAVKPQILRDVAAAIEQGVQRQKPLVISIVAGIRAADIESWLGGGLAIVRTMPNRPALVGHGATGLFGNESVREAEKELAQTIMGAVGSTVWIEAEALMDAVTALSGSGPAYFFLLMEIMEHAGKSLGLADGAAHALTVQTGYGAALMARESAESLRTLREQVTSAGGTTAAALEVLEAQGFHEIFVRAIKAAEARSKELADEFGKG